MNPKLPNNIAIGTYAVRRSDLREHYRFFKSIDEAVAAYPVPIEIFEVEFKSIGYFKRKATFEKCEPPEPLPVTPGVAVGDEDEDEDF
jgi:hypothetical protein